MTGHFWVVDSLVSDNFFSFRWRDFWGLCRSRLIQLENVVSFLKRQLECKFEKNSPLRICYVSKRFWVKMSGYYCSSFKIWILNVDSTFWQEPIPTSLLKINSDLISRAVKLFQVILKYMGIDSSDRVSPTSLDERIELVSKLYKHSLKRSELRDELFMQVSKQTRNNPDRCVFWFSLKFSNP